MSAIPVKVLVPLDGSQLAERALSYLPVLSRFGPLRLRLVSVAEDPRGYDVPDPAEFQGRQAKLLQAYLEQQRQALEAQDIQAELVLRRGSPATTVLTEAEVFEPDFLVISTHGRSGLQRWRIGSVADQVIRAAGWDTLVIGPQPLNWPPGSIIHSVLVPLDGSELAEEALPAAIRFANVFGARLHLVRVVTYPVMGGEATGAAIEAVRGAAEAYIEAKVKELAELTPGHAVLFGAPADVLTTYAEEKHISLIALTSHGRGGIVRSTLGSVADRLIVGPSPVLVIHPDAT